MKNMKKFLMGVGAFFAVSLTSCMGSGGNIFSEQYFEQPSIVKNVMSVELLHKDESKWLDVVKQKATTVGLKVAELGAGSKDPKANFDVYLRQSDVYLDDGAFKSKVQEQIDKYDLQYLPSEYYKIPETSKPDVETEPKGLEGETTEETPAESSTMSESTTEKSDISEVTSEVTSAPIESEEPGIEVNPLFPISYGTKDALAAKFSLNIGKVIDEIKEENSQLFKLRVSLQKFDTKTGILGCSEYTLSYVDAKVDYAIKASVIFEGKTEPVYIVPGKPVAFVADYFESIKSMLGVDAKFVVTFEGAEAATEIDLENTVFVDEAEAANVPEGAFNVHGKEDLVIKLKTK